MSFSAVSSRGLLLIVGLIASGCAHTQARRGERLPGSGPAPARPAQPAVDPLIAPMLHPVREELNVIYSRGGGEDVQLDLYVPKDVTGPTPAVVILHGGGWAKGSHEIMRPAAAALAAHGYIAVSVGYRMAPRHKFPAQIHDAKSAVRWLRANAERYQIDGERIGVVGFSAGAHLALLLGLTEPKDGLEGAGGNAELSSRVQAVVNVSGPTDLTKPGWDPAIDGAIADLLGGTRAQIPGVFWAASPLAYVHRGAPPILTVHGTEDTVVPYEQAQLLHASLRKAKDVSQFQTLHGKDHGGNWSGKDSERCVASILAFLDKHLRQ